MLGLEGFSPCAYPDMGNTNHHQKGQLKFMPTTPDQGTGEKMFAKQALEGQLAPWPGQEIHKEHLMPKVRKHPKTNSENLTVMGGSKGAEGAAYGQR